MGFHVEGGGIPADRDPQSETAEMPLNLLLPDTPPRSVAAARVSQDENAAGLGKSFPAIDLPPFAEAGNREGGCFVGSSEEADLRLAWAS